MVEKTKYEILKKIDEIEIRKYPEIITASAKNTDEDSAFGVLFNYISGNNQKKEKISMTAPVISSEKIPMTAPVISEEEYMAFILPEKYKKDTVPIPKNELVKIETIHKRTIAVIRFSGRANEKSIKENEQILIKKLKNLKIQTTGETFLMRYNSPFAPGFIRRNEIAIEITNFKK